MMITAIVTTARTIARLSESILWRLVIALVNLKDPSLRSG